jgi:hypothetical protein
MNVGDPNGAGEVHLPSEGVGYARSSEDHRKGKNGRSEGALLYILFLRMRVKLN